jgi:ankyrin repeat protein
MQPVDHLIAALLAGERIRVTRLLADDPALVERRNMFGVSPRHVAHLVGTPNLLPPAPLDDPFLAAELGRLDILAACLAADPDLVHRFDGTGATALHGACYWGRHECVERLLAAGADPSVRSTDEFLRIPPLGTAIATTPGVPQPSDDPDVVLALVRLLLEHGADVEGTRGDGMTALHAAAWRGLGRVVQELLDAGADPRATAVAGPHVGQTPADTALGQGHLVLAARLDAGVGKSRPPAGRPA